MPIPNGPMITVASLRETLGRPAERPDGVRDLLAVPWNESGLVPDGATAAGPLALGDWPQMWRADPDCGPRFLIALRGVASPYRIAGIWETNPARWDEDSGADPSRRTVPVLAPAYVASAVLAGRLPEADLTFGWLSPEEQFAFI
ncbi:MAG: hypothetical protein ACRDN0_04150 [Trebonia sp.]